MFVTKELLKYRFIVIFCLFTIALGGCRKETPEEKIKRLTAALIKDSTNATLYRERELNYLYVGRKEEAIKDLDKAIKCDPNRGGDYKVRAILLMQRGDKSRGDYERAIMDLNKLIELNDSTGYALRANAYLCLRKYDLAIKEIMSHTSLVRVGLPRRKSNIVISDSLSSNVC